MKFRSGLIVVLMNMMIINSSYSQEAQDKAKAALSKKIYEAPVLKSVGERSIGFRSYSSGNIFKDNYWTAMSTGTDEYGKKIVVIARNYKNADDARREALRVSRDMGYHRVTITKKWCINRTEKLIRETPFPIAEIKVYRIH